MPKGLQVHRRVFALARMLLNLSFSALQHAATRPLDSGFFHQVFLLQVVQHLVSRLEDVVDFAGEDVDDVGLFVHNGGGETPTAS